MFRSLAHLNPNSTFPALLVSPLSFGEAPRTQTFANHSIDTHIHASQFPNSGIFGKSTLLDWLHTYTFPLESSLKDLTKARKVYNAVVRRTLAHGTTTAAYYATVDVGATNLLSDLCLSAGQRAFVGRTCMDRPGFNPDYYSDASPEAAAEATLATIEHINKIDPQHEIVAPILTPRFAPSCTEESMSALAKLQKQHNLLAQTHISENENEIQLVAELYPDSKSYANVYDDCGLLNSKMILAHAVHLTEEEAMLISQRRAKIAHCPCSNSSLTSGAARVRWLWDKGIDIGLGTDVSGGYSPSILEAARQALLVSRHVATGTVAAQQERCKLTVEEVLFLATRGGAQVVGLEDKIGGFEVGKDWDAQLIGWTCASDGDAPATNGHATNGTPTAPRQEEGNMIVFGWESWDDIIAKWLFCGDDRNTKSVWVKGRLVHARG